MPLGATILQPGLDTMPCMDPAAIRAYASRDWQALGASKRAYWAERHRREGATATLQASQALLAEMRRRPDYPTPVEREVDLAAHVRLRGLLDRAAHAFARR